MVMSERPPTQTGHELPPDLPPKFAERHGANPWSDPDNPVAQAYPVPRRPAANDGPSTADLVAQAYPAPERQEVIDFLPEGAMFFQRVRVPLFIGLFTMSIMVAIGAFFAVAHFADEDAGAHGGPVSLYGHAPPAYFPDDGVEEHPRLAHPAEGGKFAERLPVDPLDHPAERGKFEQRAPDNPLDHPAERGKFAR